MVSAGSQLHPHNFCPRDQPRNTDTERVAKGRRDLIRQIVIRTYEVSRSEKRDLRTTRLAIREI